MALVRLDAAHPVPAHQQEEVEGLQDPRVHRRQDQQDRPRPQSVSISASISEKSQQHLERGGASGLPK